MEEAPLVGEGKGAGEESAPAPSEAEPFILLPGDGELHQGAGHSSRPRWETEIQSTMPGARGVMKRT